jgi:hypothetical protein
MYAESTSAVPTVTPTRAPTKADSFYLSAEFTIPGTESALGQSVSMAGEFLVVGAPTALGDSLRTGSVSIFDAYSTSLIETVSILSGACYCVCMYLHVYLLINLSLVLYTDFTYWWCSG